MSITVIYNYGKITEEIEKKYRLTRVHCPRASRKLEQPRAIYEGEGFEINSLEMHANINKLNFPPEICSPRDSHAMFCIANKSCGGITIMLITLRNHIKPNTPEN